MRLLTLLLFCVTASVIFQLIGCDDVSLNDNSESDNFSGIKISPKGERRLRAKKRPKPKNETASTTERLSFETSLVKTSLKDDDTSTTSMATANDAVESFSKRPNFLQLIPFRLRDGTPMLRWRPGKTKLAPLQRVNNI